MAEPTVCVKALRPPFFAAAARTGLSIPALAAAFDVAPGLLGDLGARVPHGAVVRVWDGLAARCEDDGFGLTAAALLGAPQLDLVDHVLQRAPTLRHMIASFARYQRLFHDANDVRVVEEPDALALLHGFTVELPRSRHFTEFVLAIWMARLRSLLGARGVPQRVSFRHARGADAARYRACFGVDPTFEADADALALPRAVLDEPVAAGDAGVAAAFGGHLDEELRQLPDASYPDLVRAELERRLRAGDVDALDIAAVARRLGVSRRTLQRRLLEDGTTFRDQVDAARRAVALAELGRGVSTVTDLAFVLGFSELSAFSRAFRRWTGKSPAVYARGAC